MHARSRQVFRFCKEKASNCSILTITIRDLSFLVRPYPATQFCMEKYQSVFLLKCTAYRCDRQGWNLLFWAIGSERGPSGDSPDRVRCISAIAAEMVRRRLTLDCRDVPHGRTPLHWAAAHNLPGAVRALLASGAAIDPPDNEGISPLILALALDDGTGARIDNAAAVAALLAAGASVDMVIPAG